MQMPELPLELWEKTKMTIHLYVQIVGKVKLKSMPRKNHWWNITLRVNTKGLTTGTMPYKDGCFDIQFNFIKHEVEINTSNGGFSSFSLHDGLTVADFYKQLFDDLHKLDVQVKIINKPYSLPDANPITTPFSEITAYGSYQKEYVESFWKILLWVHNIFTEFSGRYYGKSSPVQLFWHHLDLVVTRFSNKKIPLTEGMRLSDKDAYSHEVVSIGFWAGDENIKAPAFYSYTYPSPPALDQQPLQPTSAKWVDSNGSPMAILMYADLIQQEDPRIALLNFMEAAYVAGASLAGWDIVAMKVPALTEM